MTTMPLVSVFIDRNGNFGAFWRDHDGDLVLFAPHRLERIFHANLKRWQDNRDRLSTLEERETFDDDLLCACYDFSLSGMFIEKTTVRTLALPLGAYYPRVWRGLHSVSFVSGNYRPRPLSPTEHASKLQSTVAATSLFQELVQLFRYIEPASGNSRAYGHRVRELLILACTEVEANMRGVISANTPGFAASTVLKTSNYVKLLPLLRLNEWSVALDGYVDYKLISPFADWSASMPTKSLSWYNAYNEVKHDREGNFEKATLEHLIDAMAAIHIIQAAQWGPSIYSEPLQKEFSPFRLGHLPAPDITQLYICPPTEAQRILNYFE